MEFSIDVIALITGLIGIVSMFVKIQVDIKYIQRDLLKLSKREEERCKIEKGRGFEERRTRMWKRKI